ncbi:carbohydrate esterase family 5 protein [Aulographum hederae CBS 113979]|uniref:Cutinase n=1 Tax=Aulographum hederae CBS 113979 TaxID=1176131 RepID=A0A6G1GRB6_9PEZI|nr:carbohydrate esterase family 5 protein [Aulographum hederae CBS 113979]
MKFTNAVLALAGAAAASPIALEERQFGNVGINAGDLEGLTPICRDVTFIFARGSTEIGNMGSLVGPPVANGLKDRLGRNNVAVQGVNYAAGLTTNFLPSGGDPLGVRDMTSQFETASRRCPSTKIVAGGYSQGAAITHESVESLPRNIINQIVGIVTFGDTQNLQDRGQINNFPRERLLVICNVGDLVCSGTLVITAAHLTYSADAGRAVNFLVQRVNSS